MFSLNGIKIFLEKLIPVLNKRSSSFLLLRKTSKSFNTFFHNQEAFFGTCFQGREKNVCAYLLAVMILQKEAWCKKKRDHFLVCQVFFVLKI